MHPAPQVPADQVNADPAEQDGKIDQQHGAEREQETAAGIQHRRENLHLGLDAAAPQVHRPGTHKGDGARNEGPRQGPLAENEQHRRQQHQKERGPEQFRIGHDRGLRRIEKNLADGRTTQIDRRPLAERQRLDGIMPAQMQLGIDPGRPVHQQAGHRMGAAVVDGLHYVPVGTEVEIDGIRPDGTEGRIQVGARADDTLDDHPGRDGVVEYGELAAPDAQGVVGIGVDDHIRRQLGLGMGDVPVEFGKPALQKSLHAGRRSAGIADGTGREDRHDRENDAQRQQRRHYIILECMFPTHCDMAPNG